MGTTNEEVINIKDGATGVTIPGDHQVNVAYKPGDASSSGNSPRPSQASQLSMPCQPVGQPTNIPTKH